MVRLLERSTAAGSTRPNSSQAPGVLITIAVDKTGVAPPVVEHTATAIRFVPVDAVAAGKTRRKPRELPAPRTVAFDPAGANRAGHVTSYSRDAIADRAAGCIP